VIHALDTTEKMIYLRAIPVAAELSTAVLRVLASSFRERTFEAGTRLMELGRPIAALHLLTEGKVSLVRKGTSLGTLEPPQSLGFLGILARGDGTYDATVEEDVRALELDAATILQLMEDHFEFLRAILRYLAARMQPEIAELPESALDARFDGASRVDTSRPLDLVQRLLYLRTLGSFERTNLESLAILSRRAEELRLRPGETIWSLGDVSNSMVMTLSGTAIQEVPEPPKRWRVGPNSVLGALEAWAAMSRWTDLSAGSDLVALRVGIDDFWDLLEDDFETGSRLIGFMAADLVEMLAAKAARGQTAVAVQRVMPGLGKVPVGA